MLAVFVAAPAHARFGKSSGGSGSHSSSSSSSSSSTHHSSAPVGSVPRTGSGSSSGGSYSPSYGYSNSYPYSTYRPWSYGFYSGAFVPTYGYGYGYYGARPYGYGFGNYGYGATPYSQGIATDSGVRAEPSALRMTVGAEGMGYVSAERGGFGLGVVASFEGERWGVNLAFQNIAAPSQDVVGEYDNIQQFNARVSFAFLTGKYGRLRLEAGADSIFAQNLIVLAPTAGVSGTLWVGGPFALEGSIAGAIWPIRELDYRVGAVVGLGPIGFRAGWRTQVLDDQGLVDGVVNRDVFMGPYAGIGLAF